MKPWRVLVFPGGTEIGLEINSALRDCKEVELYSAGAPTSSHAPFVFNIHDVVPGVQESCWLEELGLVVRNRKIDFIIPAHDDVVVALAKHRDQLLPAQVISSPLRTCEICRSKLATYDLLRGKVQVPKVYSRMEEVEKFPAFVKPDRGQGSQFASKVTTALELNVAFAGRPGMIALEYLPGDEFTVDCFSDRERGLLFCGGRQRDRVRSGISVASHLIHNPEFETIAQVIASSMEFWGAWFFQLKRSAEGVLTVLEVAPRIAGAMALNRCRGVNFALLSLFESLRRPVSILTHSVEPILDRALINRYQANIDVRNVYVDLDDTLIVHGKVNLALIRFIFQSINKGARICLVTRHGADVQQTLVRHRLGGIFDRIFHLKDREPKSSAVDARDGAIFIDDSFSERAQVSAETGIPTFDNSMIELLQDYRA